MNQKSTPAGRNTKNHRQGSRVQARQAAQRRTRLILIAATGVVIVVAIVVALLATGGGKKSSTTTLKSTDATAVVQAVASIPGATYDAVGVGDASNAPTPFAGTALTKNGKPELLYIGAEYCPYCAAERWSMVAALSRFGTFSNVSLTHSASEDVFPDTQTFSFYGATYQSDYLEFTAVETNTNELSGGGYKALQTPTAQQAAAAAETGQRGIPFLDFGGKYYISGATYNPDVLSERTAPGIAQLMADPTSAIGRAALGAANGITAAICAMTGNKPAAVCDSTGVKAARAAIGG